MLKAVTIAAMFATMAASPPPPAPCVSKEALRDMIVLVTPPLVDTLRQKCRNGLPASAFLNQDAADWVAHIRAAGAGREVNAAKDMSMLAGGKLREIQDKKALAQVMSDVMANKFAESFKPAQCGAANAFIEALAPLPPESFGRVIVSFFRLADVRNPPICPDA